jgi:hypothetical protein
MRERSESESELGMTDMEDLANALELLKAHYERAGLTANAVRVDNLRQKLATAYTVFVEMDEIPF